MISHFVSFLSFLAPCSPLILASLVQTAHWRLNLQFNHYVQFYFAIVGMAMFKNLHNPLNNLLSYSENFTTSKSGRTSRFLSATEKFPLRTIIQPGWVSLSSLSLSLFDFLSVADLSATDYGIAAECSLSVRLSVSVCLCQPLKSCEVSLRFF